MKGISFFAMAALALAMASCGGSKEKAADSTPSAGDFAAEQPLKSGLYEATYFNIKGADARKGSFDGRIVFSLSPEQSAFLVYENGNRTKIKHMVLLDSGFEKTDSVFSSRSKDGQPVVLAPDSAGYGITYIQKADTVTISFNSKPKTEYTPIEALTKIKEEVGK